MRILCLGIGSETSSSYTHHALDDECPTIFDYDLVIMDQYYLNRSFFKTFAERRDEFEKFFQSNGVCYVILNKYLKEGPSSNFDWFPLSSQIRVENKPGKTVTCKNNDARFIFDKIEFKWQCFFSEYPDYAIVLAVNRVNDPISIKVPYENGYCIFLPLTDQTSKLVDLLIKEGLNIIPEKEGEIGKTELPSWANALMTKTELKLLETRNEIVEKLGKYNKFKPLYWETGDRLQELVIEAFEEMGIEVTKLPKESHGDFEFSVEEDLTGVCEVKGLSGNADRRNLRQVLDYFIEQRDIEKRNVKGVLIVNHYRNEKPTERGNPVTEDALDLIKTYKFHVLTTIQLYDCLTKFWGNKLTKDDFLKGFKKHHSGS